MISLEIDANNEPIPKRRKIDAATVLEMAQLMAKRINETGAALMLGIKPDTWFKWKGRTTNASRFASLLLRVREAKLNATIESIDEAGEDFEVPTESGSYTKRGDWRAKAWIAERVLAPERFAQQTASVTVNQTAVTLNCGGEPELAKLVRASAEQARAMLATRAQGQLAAGEQPAIDVSAQSSNEL